MIKILFLIHDLGQGGAEKVLVNLVNHMDTYKFDITVMSLFDCGENKQFLSRKIKYKYCYKKMIKGNSHLMKLLSSEQLHKKLIKDKYDIEISYLEGPCARIISGCTDPDIKKVCWIHIEQHTKERVSASFRSYQEAVHCYNQFDNIVCVSETVKSDFSSLIPLKKEPVVLYNTNDSQAILQLSEEPITDIEFDKDEIKLVGVGKLLQNKGFDRLLRITERLRADYPVHLYILGSGPDQEKLELYIQNHQMSAYVDLLGYQLNPYKYMKQCDLFVCASHAEGFSTAATEALILGVPVCTVEVSGMKEMLGSHNEYGIVTSNDDEALYEGIRSLLADPQLLQHYKEAAIVRGKDFSTSKTVNAVEKMLLSLRKQEK